MIDLKDVDKKLALAQFKANNAFSHSDIANMLSCTIDQSKIWSKQGAPDKTNHLIRACDIAIVRWREASRAFSDIDRQLYESQIGLMQKKLRPSEIEHSIYKDDCESESILNIIPKRIKRKTLWFKITSPFKNISTRGE